MVGTPGNTNLLIGAWTFANREMGVPGGLAQDCSVSGQVRSNAIHFLGPEAALPLNLAQMPKSASPDSAMSSNPHLSPGWRSLFRVPGFPFLFCGHADFAVWDGNELRRGHMVRAGSDAFHGQG